jgi:hypothetical protein
MKCTWVGCAERTTIPQRANDGSIWATLCSAHHEQVERHIREGNAKGILSDWVKAQGGAKKAAARMMR